MTPPVPPPSPKEQSVPLPDDRFRNEPFHPRIRGRCPSCGAEALFLGSNGYATCSVIGCKDPGAATDLLAFVPPPDVTAGLRAEIARLESIISEYATGRTLQALRSEVARLRAKPLADPSAVSAGLRERLLMATEKVRVAAIAAHSEPMAEAYQAHMELLREAAAALAGEDSGAGAPRREPEADGELLALDQLGVACNADDADPCSGTDAFRRGAIFALLWMLGRYSRPPSQLINDGKLLEQQDKEEGITFVCRRSALGYGGTHLPYHGPPATRWSDGEA